MQYYTSGFALDSAWQATFGRLLKMLNKHVLQHILDAIAVVFMCFLLTLSKKHLSGFAC